MNNHHQGASAQTASREEYRSLDNRVTSILQQRWPANEINQWVEMLKGKQQSVACAILRRRHPRPTLLALPAIATEVPNPFQAKNCRPTVTVLSADGRYAGKRHVVEGRTPVAIDHSGTIRCAKTARTLWIAPGSITDRANPGAAEQLNPTYQPTLHQVVADHRQHVEKGSYREAHQLESSQRTGTYRSYQPRNSTPAGAGHEPKP